jgi:hypothetical protein
MKMEPREIGVVAEAAAFLVAAVLAVTPVVAQQVTGELGSPSATTTINGKQLPPPPSAIWRSDQAKRLGFQALVAAPHCAAQRRAQRVAHHDR